MSYILDALKRADAERERGAVPGLHAQPAAMPLPDDDGTRPLPSWAWGVGGLAVALLGMLAWSMWRGDEAPPAEASSRTSPGGPGTWNPSTERRPPPQAGEASGPWVNSGGSHPPRPGGMHEPRGALSGMPQGTGRHDAGMAPRAMPPSGQERPARAASDNAAPRLAQATQQPGQGAGQTTPAPTPAPAQVASTSTAAPVVADAAAANTRVYALHELPDQVRRSLPQLVIGGAMYSDNPGSRMLVINSQLFHEGDKLGPDLTLEEIKLKSAVLRYRNWRYGVTY